MECGCRSITEDQISSTRVSTRHCGLVATRTLCAKMVEQKQQRRRSRLDQALSPICKEGHLKEALNILKERGIPADSNTYVCLLQECIKVKGLAEGKQVHSHIIRNGFKANIFLHNTLVNMYSKCGSVVDARLVFDKMPERDMFTWNIMMAGYARHGCGKNVFKIYEQMIQEGITPDKVTFICVLKACARLADLEKGKVVHADIIKGGIVPDIILETALVNMYAKCGSLKYGRQVFESMAERNVVSWSAMITGYAQQGCVREALQLFEQMQQEGFKPNVVSWNAMIAGYAQHGCCREAFEIYEQMIREGVTPDAVTFICILNACTLADPEKGREIHGDIIKAGIVPDVILETALVSMYAKCRNMKVARQVFENMAKRNVVSWNAMIAGYAQHGCGGETLQLFQKMKQESFKPNAVSSREAFKIYEQMIHEGVMPNRVTFISLANACASLAVLEKGIQVHTEIIKAGISPDIILENTLIDMYAKCGSIKDAHRLFDNMAERDVISWTAIIAGYAWHGYSREAMQLFDQMKQEGLTPNVVSWSAIIAGYAQHGCGWEVLETYEQMVQEGVTPNQVTCVCVLSACAHLAALEKGKEVHALIIKARIELNIILENTLLDMYAKCGSIKDARQVFDNMALRDVVSWSAMIAGYAQHGFGMEAVQLFERMLQQGLKLDSITFTCVLSACSHAGLVDEGRHYFESMIQDHGLTPTMEHFCCMVDLLGRAGKLAEAEDFITKMRIKPGASVWGALLGACKIHGNVVVAERAAICRLRSDPQDADTYVLLSNIYAAAGRWDDTAKVRKMMKDRS